MIDPDTITEILKIYKKHGWTLRRVLLSEELQNNLGETKELLFPAADISSSDIDAAWFSRASDGSRETWELRHLNETPFALLEVMDNTAAESEHLAVWSETENRLREIVSDKASSG